MNTSASARVIAFLGLLASTLPVRGQLYSAKDLSPLGIYGTAINGFGEVTGIISTAGHSHAVLWNGATARDLGTLGGTGSSGNALNGSGNITGSSDLAGDTVQHAFLWNGTSMVDLGTLGGSNSEGTAINASGEVTGWSDMPGNLAKHAFLWNGSKMKDLGTLGGTNSAGVAINDSGQVTGSSDITGNAYSHAFLWSGASMKDLGTLPGSRTMTPSAMNNAGQVVGYSHNASGTIYTGFLWNGSKLVNLSVLAGATQSGAAAINAKGQVTGGVTFRQKQRGPAYLWTSTTAVNLIANSDPRGEGYCSGGTSISSSTGLVVGNTCEEGGFIYSFFWNGFAIRDFADLVVPSDLNLDTWATPYINNQGQILDGWYVLSPIPGAIALDIAYPSSFAGCQNVTAYVSSATPAPKGGLVVSLSDDLAAASVPSTATIPAGAIGTTFTITTMPVTSVHNGTVTATLGTRTVSQPLSIRPIGVSAITVTPNPVKGGNPVTGNVTLECSAAPASINVTLSSDDPSVAKPVQATITIPKGQSSKSFQVTTKPVAARVKVVITASANGVSKTANLNVNR